MVSCDAPLSLTGALIERDASDARVATLEMGISQLGSNWTPEMVRFEGTWTFAPLRAELRS